MTTGQKITELRKKSNITQEQLADLVSVSRQSVSKWESDLAYPETEKLISLSKIFHCSVDYLLKENISSSNNPHNVSLLPKEKSQNDEEIHKKEAINKKGLPFSIASLIFAIVNLIFFAVPIAQALIYVPGYGQIYIAANFYQIVFSSSYSYGNIPFLLDFLIILAILTLGILYLFFEKKGICLSLKILTTSFIFFYFLALLVSSNSAIGTFYSLLIIMTAYMIVVWSIKPFRFNRKLKTKKTNIAFQNKQVDASISSNAMVMSKDDEPTKANAANKPSSINKKGLPLAITGLAFSIVTMFLFLVPIIDVYSYVSGVGTLSFSANFYQVAFSSNYQSGNILFTLDFVVILSVLTISILYLFFDKRGLWISLKVLTTCFTFLYCLMWLLLIDNADLAFFVFALLYLAYMIIMWSIKPFRYHRKIK